MSQFKMLAIVLSLLGMINARSPMDWGQIPLVIVSVTILKLSASLVRPKAYPIHLTQERIRYGRLSSIPWSLPSGF